MRQRTSMGVLIWDSADYRRLVPMVIDRLALAQSFWGYWNEMIDQHVLYFLCEQAALPKAMQDFFGVWMEQVNLDVRLK